MREENTDASPAAIRALRSVLANDAYACPATRVHLRRQLKPFDPRHGQNDGLKLVCLMIVLGLTRPRAEVALLKYLGLTEPQIADRLHLSRAAVHQRITQLYSHHEIRDEVHLAVLSDRALTCWNLEG